MPEQILWYTFGSDKVLARLKSSVEGLSSVEAKRRLGAYGPNRLVRVRHGTWFRILLRQLNNPLVYVLTFSALITVLIGKTTDGLVVVSVVVINTIIGFFQEYRAGKAIDALTQIVSEKATVVRDDQQRDIRVFDIVPGDIVLLESGDMVPADIRLLEISNLAIEEAALTGESVAVSKSIDPVGSDAVLGDRKCIAFGGTLVTSGTATGVVVATGADTEMGQISRMLSETSSIVTPLTRRLATIAHYLTIGILVVAGAIFVVGLLRAYSLSDSALAAITLAVASIPEGLPAVITIASAIGVRRMARLNAIIRYLPAVETLGSTTVICTDKTGTLTRNEMTVQAIWSPEGLYKLTGVGYVPTGELRKDDQVLTTTPGDVQELLLVSLLCNDATLVQENERWNISGDPTEAALVVGARKIGFDENLLRDQWARLDEIPFDSDQQFMATLHEAQNKEQIICLKGAPEVIIKMCQSFADGTKLNSGRIFSVLEKMANKGMRVLAIASYRPKTKVRELKLDETGLPFSFLGIVGMVDPPRTEALHAIEQCKRAGVNVKMVTGDHQATARAIGELLELIDHQLPYDVVTGNMLANINDIEMEQMVKSSNIFARVAPIDKLRLVKALQAKGEIVAMTGDGVNDAPSLKRADIGVAMGVGGTAVAREASDMVLADDNFASIVAAVEEGRHVYDNLIKSLAFILPTSLGQAMIILIAVLFFPLERGHLLMPIQPVQILWVNLVVAIALALPLAMESKEPDVMRRPPRATDAPVLSAFIIIRTFLVGLLMSAGAVWLFLYEYLTDIGNGIDLSIALIEAQTIAVTTIIIFQSVYLLNCRSLTDSVFRIGFFSNKFVFYGIAVTIVLQLCLIYVPALNRLFHTSALNITDWIAPVLVGFTGLPVIIFEKWLWRLRQSRKAQTSK